MFTYDVYKYLFRSSAKIQLFSVWLHWGDLDNFLKCQTGSGIFRHFLQLGTARVEKSAIRNYYEIQPLLVLIEVAQIEVSLYLRSPIHLLLILIIFEKSLLRFVKRIHL